MTTVLDLVTAFHDIDALKGRVCGKCEFCSCLPAGMNGTPVKCSKGWGPHNADDGCDDWQARHTTLGEAKAQAAVVMSV